MIKLVKLRLHNFKSFKKAVIPISIGFTAIGGANGSGKSNVLDAIQFVLGATSLKTLRASKLTELINHDAQEKTAEVSIEIEAIKENQKNIYSVSREIDLQGKSVYRLDGKRKTLNEISSLLKELRIHGKGYNIVAQGDIAHLTEMNSIERRAIIDDVSGIRDFDEKKMEALKELEKVDIKIKEARIIINERETYLKQLEEEKNCALEYTGLISELKQSKKTIIGFELKEIQKNISEKEKKLALFAQKITDYEKEKNLVLEQIINSAKELESFNLELINLSSKTALGIGRLLEEKKANQKLLLEKIELRKKNVAQNQNSIKMLNENSESALNELNEVNQLLAKKENTTKLLNNELEDIQKRKNALLQGLSASTELNETEKKLKETILLFENKQKESYAKQSELKIIEKEIDLSNELIERLNSSQSAQEKSFNELLEKALNAEKILKQKEKETIHFIKELKLTEKEKNAFIESFNELAKCINNLVLLVKENIKQGKSKMRIEENDLKISQLNKKLEQIKKESSLIETSLKELASQKQDFEKEINYLKLKFKVSDLKDLDSQLREKMNLINQNHKSINEFKTRIDLVLNVRLKHNQESVSRINNSSNEIEKEVTLLENELQKTRNEELELEIKLKKSSGVSKEFEEKKTVNLKKSALLANKKERIEINIKNTENENQQLLIESGRWEVRLQDLLEEEKEFAEFNVFEKFDINKLRQRVPEIERRIRAIEPVNMKSIEVFGKLHSEFVDLKSKADKLDSERLAVLEMINKIDLKRNVVFMDCFNKIALNFSEIYSNLADTQGKLELSNKENPLESGLLIQASYSGNKLKSIDSLSGGEKTLTALAFLFAIQNYSPAPFYLFDEADAALDKQNSDKLAKIIKSVALHSQFIAITHNDFLFKEADQIIGVALNEKKSSVIGLKIKEELKENSDTQKQQATN